MNNFRSNVRRAVGSRVARTIRSAGRRVLGEAPPSASTAVSTSTSASASASAAGAKPAKKKNPWIGLREHGLRIQPGLGFFGSGPGRIKVRFEPPAQLNNASMHVYRDIAIGRYSFLRGGRFRYIDTIGRYTSIGPDVTIGEGEHPVTWLTSSPAVHDAKRYRYYPPEADSGPRTIKRTADNIDPMTMQNAAIGNDVWIGANVMIRRGVTIGDGAIVAAGAFVNKDVPPYTIVGGLPAKVIGKRFSDEIIERLLALKWWEFDVSDLAGVAFDDIEKAIEQITERERAGEITRVPVSYDEVEIDRSGYRSLTVHPLNAQRAEERMAKLGKKPKKGK